MTNKEYYKEQIFEIACQGYSIAFDERTNKIVECAGLSCEYCKFAANQGKCEETISKWLKEEYKEPPVDWTKVAVDTKILVTNFLDKGWKKRYFAKYKNGQVYAFLNGRTSWSTEDADNISDWEYAKLWKEE